MICASDLIVILAEYLAAGTDPEIVVYAGDDDAEPIELMHIYQYPEENKIALTE